jgi:hypothetical protein
MKSKNHDEIVKLDEQIEALECQRNKLRQEDYELEQKARKDAWEKENADGIKFCQKLAGKAFTFGKDIIKHYYWKPFEKAFEYDYVSVYFPLNIDYYDKYRVYLACRHFYTDEHRATLTNQHHMVLKVSYLDGTYQPTEHERYDGAVHLLTDAELKLAFDFWMKKANTVFADEFTRPTNKPWECSFDPDRFKRRFKGIDYSDGEAVAKAELDEDEQFSKDLERVLVAREAYYKTIEQSNYSEILQAITERHGGM